MIGGKLYVLKDVGTGCGDLSVPKEECHKAAEKEYVSEKGFKIRDLDFFVENEESTPPGCYLGHKHSCKRSCVYAYNMYDPSKAWTCADKCQPYAEVFFNENPKGTTGSNFREANQITRIRSVCQYKKGISIYIVSDNTFVQSFKVFHCTSDNYIINSILQVKDGAEDNSDEGSDSGKYYPHNAYIYIYIYIDHF